MQADESAIERIKAQLVQLGPVLPGSLSKQWNVCGSPGCRCKDPKHPRRHGPYHQLSYTLRGKSSTVFVRAEDVAEVRRRLRRYGEFKRLCGALVAAYIGEMRQQGINRRES
jgi:hypothetical protein